MPVDMFQLVANKYLGSSRILWFKFLTFPIITIGLSHTSVHKKLSAKHSLNVVCVLINVHFSIYVYKNHLKAQFVLGSGSFLNFRTMICR